MIGAIVLAAGASRRMGVQKLLLPFAGQTVIAHIVRQLECSPFELINVVVGGDAGRIASALAGRPVRLVTNPDPDGGKMLSSVRCGLAALPAGCAGALVALGDQPALAPALVDRLIAKFSANPRSILVPAHAGRRGHPLLIPACFFAEIMTRHDDAGLRGLLLAHPAAVVEVTADSPAVLSDMDYPEDYQRELERFRNAMKGGESS